MPQYKPMNSREKVRDRIDRYHRARFEHGIAWRGGGMVKLDPVPARDEGRVPPSFNEVTLDNADYGNAERS